MGGRSEIVALVLLYCHLGSEMFLSEQFDARKIVNYFEIACEEEKRKTTRCRRGLTGQPE
jgi:hypothetical protein